jgi:Mrp family chromosome partitioning ATPase
LVNEEDVLKALRAVSDPELGRDIVSLHMVENVVIDGGVVGFTLNLTTPACPLRTRIEEGARAAVMGLKGVQEVRMKTTSSVMATRPYAQTDVLRGVKNVIAVASGKGGVGKSTVAANLAVALAGSGARVGILDADIYGPNIPLMMGVKDKPAVKGEILVPPVAHGVKVMSLGFFYKDSTPLIWRGPMVAGAVKQMLTQVEWGELDYLVCDMPPGCLPAGTFVLTANNCPKPIEDIKVGEFVYSFDGDKLVPRRVTGVIPQGMQGVFRVATPNRTIIASANHPFLKYYRKVYFRRLDQLKAGDRIVVAGCVAEGRPLPLPKIKNARDAVALPEVTTPEFMRIVGHFVGDGFIRINRRRRKILGLRICEPEGGKFRREYEELYRKVFKCNIFKDGPKFAVASKPLSELFIALDLNHPARKKLVPEWVFSLPLDQRLAFLEGYAQADGHIRHREATKDLPAWNGVVMARKIVQDTVSIESTNEFLVRQLHELCQMSGVRATNTHVRDNAEKMIEGRRIGPSTSYGFEFSSKVDIRPFKLARIRSIEPFGEMETFDLQVDQFENFVANGFVVHNTGDASLTLAQTVPLGGVIIVTTPQEAALAIATKALAMFRKLNVPILGIVENMSYFVCPHCGEKTYIFSTGGGRRVASMLNVDFLGEIPIESSIREQSDLGVPVVVALPASPQANIFKDFAFRVAGLVSIVAFAKSSS